MPTTDYIWEVTTPDTNLHKLKDAESMHYRGTLGTGGDITVLPTASASNKGDTYKVITDGTYAGQEAKAGDLFISDGSSWILISGSGGGSSDDTWRNIKVNGTEKLGTATNTGAVDFINGTNTSVSFDSSGNKIKVNVTGLGTAAYKDVPSSGNASTSQVVMGNDTRLTDARPASDVSAWAKASTKPTYTASEVGAIAASAKGAANGLAELDSTGKVPSSQLPSYVDDVIEVADYAHLPITGESGKIYVTLDTNLTYRWSGSEYVEVSKSLALGETESTAYRGDRGKTAYDHATESGKISAAVSSGLYKIAATAQGHVAGLTAVQKSDITALGIPGSDTNTHRPIQVNGTQNLGDNTTPLNLKNGTNITVTADGGNVTIATSAEVNQNAFSNVKVGSTTVAADSKTDTLELVAGSNVTLTPDATNDKITIAATDTNTTYTFAGGTNKFTVTPSGGTAQTVTVTPSIANNITGSGTSGYIAKFNGTNTITNGPAFGTATTTYLRNDGSWATPTDTNTHRPIQVNGTEILGNNTTALNLKAGSNISLTNSNGTVTIAATDTKYTAATAAPGNIASSGAVGTSTNYARQDHTHGITLATGDNNGQVKIAGTNVSVKGLGSNAYTSTAYLPLAGGTMSGGITFNKVNNAIAYTGTKATYGMIKFIDNTGDEYGNGISIGGGGLTIIGGGESADAIADGKSGGSEMLYLSNDQNVQIITGVQNGLSSAKTFDFKTDGTATFDGKWVGRFTANPTSGQVVITDGTTGGMKSSGYTIAKSVPSNAVFTDTHRPIQMNGTEILGNNTTALNLKAGSNVSLTNSSGTVTIAATDTNTHRPIQMNGTEILGNNTTALNLKQGSNVTLTNSSGTVTIAATNTLNTAGSTDTSSKIFLIGATSQAANPQTYSDNEVYATSGVLTTKSVQVGGTAATMQYNSTNHCIDFIVT